MSDSPHPSKAGKDFRKIYHLLAIGVLLLALSTVFAPAIVQTYGMLDDYEMLSNKAFAHGPINKSLFFKEGRPISGLFIHYSFKAVQSVEDLRWIRLLGVAGLVLFGWILINYLTQRLKVDSLHALAITLAILLTPGGLLLGSWATVSFYIFGFILAFLSGVVIEKPHLNGWHWLVSFSLAFASLCIYQAMVAAVLLPILFSVMLGNRFSIRKLIPPVSIYISSIGLYFVLWKAAIRLKWIPGDREVRSGEWTDMASNLITFFTDTIPTLTAGTSYLVHFNFQTWVWCAVLIFWVYLLIRSNDSILNGISLITTVLGLLVLMALPVIKSGYSPFRTLVVLGGVIQCLPVMALQNCAPLKRKAASIAFTILFFAAACLTINMTLVKIQSSEYKHAKLGIGKFALEFADNPVGPIFLRLPKSPGDQLVRNLAEYGNYTSSNPWASASLVNQLMIESYGLKQPEADFIKTFTEICPIDSNTSVESAHNIELAQLLSAHSFETIPENNALSSFESFTKTPTGWMRKMGDRWFWHELLGWCQIYADHDRYEWVHTQWFETLLVDFSKGYPSAFFFPDSTPVSEAELKNQIKTTFNSFVSPQE